jgi:hypothetical protein
VIVEPPSSAGALKDTDILPTPVFEAEPTEGAPGTVLGIGKMPAVTCCIACEVLNTPVAVPDFPPVVVGLVLFINPPNQRVDIN